MYMLEGLQKVKNSAARLIFKCRKQNHISPLLMSLHWLPINARIECKLSVICHSFFLGLLLLLARLINRQVEVFWGSVSAVHDDSTVSVVGFEGQ